MPNPAPRRRHEQREGEVGRGVGQDTGRVGHYDAAGRAGGNVNVVVTHAAVRHHAELAGLAQYFLVDADPNRQQPLSLPAGLAKRAGL